MGRSGKSWHTLNDPPVHHREVDPETAAAEWEKALAESNEPDGQDWNAVPPIRAPIDPDTVDYTENTVPFTDPLPAEDEVSPRWKTKNEKFLFLSRFANTNRTFDECMSYMRRWQFTYWLMYLLVEAQLRHIQSHDAELLEIVAPGPFMGMDPTVSSGLISLISYNPKDEGQHQQAQIRHIAIHGGHSLTAFAILPIVRYLKRQEEEESLKRTFVVAAMDLKKIQSCTMAATKTSMQMRQKNHEAMHLHQQNGGRLAPHPGLEHRRLSARLACTAIWKALQTMK